LHVIGLVLVAVGVICLWVGDKDVPVKGGRVLRLFSYPRGAMRWMKWPMGVALIYAGIEVLRK